MKKKPSKNSRKKVQKDKPIKLVFRTVNGSVTIRRNIGGAMQICPKTILEPISAETLGVVDMRPTGVMELFIRF